MGKLLLGYQDHHLQMEVRKLFGGEVVKKELRKRMLSVRITYKRKMMYVKAKEFGYTHPEVVAHSQDLDDLLNRYQGIIS
uniref:aspartyl-phosphate phosphatase Spo0E family protein n=1 Tax=Sporosarcina sp. FSL K6-1522 TaxID=2921554 RepID=UPI00406CB3ED